MPKPVIVLSAGGERADLDRWGLGPEHVNDLLVQLSKRLLQQGCRLAYGGTLSVPGHTMTRTLLDVATRWERDNPLQGREGQADEWPLINYAAWPYHSEITTKHRADNAGICRFVDVDPEGVPKEWLASSTPDLDASPAAQRHRADALSRMRELSTVQSEARVVMAGAIHGYAGWLPGICEEVVCSVKHDRPLLILGGFGGCAALLADYLLHDIWPKELTFEACAAKGPMATLVRRHDHAAFARARFDEMKKVLGDLRDQLDKGSVGRVPASAWSDLLVRGSIAGAVRQVGETLVTLGIGIPPPERGTGRAP